MAKKNILGLPRRWLDGQQIVKERFARVNFCFLQPPQGSEDALRTADNTPTTHRDHARVHGRKWRKDRRLRVASTAT
jgi:hypothetical protein